ncbi:hypothetical protein JCM19237_5733 [Photobacterium aphoticum]|uniref:Uncharacterized protein n=1 Tax=Photobacterium aphoticum TaxID=754436 RepID=A0A090QI65_9GAMM|nr:hypothetical protein JCM19237_5733 [Photobacterium aphoticum]
MSRSNRKLSTVQVLAGDYSWSALPHDHESSAVSGLDCS